ncbi:hypothetical protein MCOR34_004445 [Pyricularia oryzae]|nr:hypothetical protein MCOR34_004445 [Pyricularia oryzae]
MSSSIKKKGVEKKGIKDRMSLNQRESELLICAWLSLKNPQLDYKIFGAYMDIRPKTARNAFVELRKRFLDEFGAGYIVNAPLNVTTPKSKATKKKASEMLKTDTCNEQFDTNSSDPAANELEQTTSDSGYFELKEAYNIDDGRM